MRIGFISKLQEDDFRFAAEHGFPCMETNLTHDTRPLCERRDEIKRLIREFHVNLSHVGLYDNDHTSADPEVRSACAQRVRDLIGFCAEVGVPLFTTGGGHGTKDDPARSCQQTIEVLGPALEHAKRKGVKFAFYNCHWGNHVIGPKQWTPILKALPEAGIKFDPSHPFYDRLDYLKQMYEWGPKFYHVHAKGCVMLDGQRVEDPPPGLDQIDWGTFFALLYHHDYQGDVNIEPHSKTWSGARLHSGLLLGQRFLRQFILG